MKKHRLRTYEALIGGSGSVTTTGEAGSLARQLDHLRDCPECRVRWPMVSGVITMTDTPDGHVRFEVSEERPGERIGDDILPPGIAGEYLAIEAERLAAETAPGSLPGEGTQASRSDSREGWIAVGPEDDASGLHYTITPHDDESGEL